MTNTNFLKPAELLLGDLTNRDLYATEVLEEMLKASRGKPAGTFTRKIGGAGLVEVTKTEAARLQFIAGAAAKTAMGSELAESLTYEIQRRSRLTSEFRDLLKKLHGCGEVRDEEVEKAVLKYEAHQKSLQPPTPPSTQSSEPRLVPPRIALRTEDGPQSSTRAH